VLNEWQGGSILHLQKRLLDEAQRIHQEDAQMCERIASFGVELLSQACTILTHCNTGALATGGRGTALGIITKAWELGKLKRVYINETRPLLQGARLTAWEMVKQQIPATLITDSTAAFLMQKGKIDVVIVGADRIAMNGDVANKIGTYNVAVLAKHHRIPFYVAAPISTIDFQISHGKEIPIEEREGGEIKYYGGIQISPGAIDVYSPAFDVTPNEFVTAIVTNEGIMVPPFIESLKKLPLRDFSAR
jgi:methylthioribose-1-phosphate isomerase